jgi:hypothetical protein
MSEKEIASESENIADKAKKIILCDSDKPHAGQSQENINRDAKVEWWIPPENGPDR